MEKYFIVQYLDEIDNNIEKFIIVNDIFQKDISKNILFKDDPIVHTISKMKINDVNENPKFILLDKNIYLEIMEAIEDRGIEEIIHFTRIENIESIITNGILSRNKAKEKSIRIIASDTDRFDNFLDYISTSISFPNYKMFFTKREQEISEWAVIKISPSILYEKDCKFFNDNAASNKSTQIEDINEIFEENIEIKGKIKERQPYINRNMPTNPQAEVLVKDEIEVGYIKSIIVHKEEVKNQIKFKVPQINIEVDANYFYPRADYEYWKKDVDNG
jgi:hypothetical protein